MKFKLCHKIKSHHYWLIVFLLVHTILTLVYMHQQPLTNDEADYAEYSKRWLKGHPEKVKDVDDSKSPITAIAWVPRIAKQLTNSNFSQTDWGLQDRLNGRYMMFIFFFGVLFYVYKWSRDFFGVKGWQLPTVLLLIDPIFMAYTPTITTDVACAFVMIASFYHYYVYTKTKSFWQFLWCAFFSGVALITKSSLVFIPFIFFGIFLIRLLAKQTNMHLKNWWYLIVYILVVWLVVNLGYQFQHSFSTWGSLSFKSNFFKGLMQQFSFLQNLPTLLPQPFIDSFDLLQYHKDVGPYLPDFPYKGVFILNQKFVHGIWYYYLVTAFFKLPIGLLLLLLGSVIVFVKQFNAPAFISKYIFLIAPVLVYACLLSFVNPFQQGIRHCLILFPFLFIGLGYLWQYCQHFFTKGKWIIACMVAYSFISVATFYPNIMPYTNELIEPKQNAFYYIAEYNGLYTDVPKDAKGFLNTHPDFALAPSTSTKGKFIVPGAFVFNTTYAINQQYKWLQAYQPIGHYRYVFLLYEVK